jgi:penicillin amidase
MQSSARLFLLVSLACLFAQRVVAEDFNFPGLSGPVQVFEDQYGIPTIKGESQLDVTFVQGYIHARDRFFQMDRDRKGAAGRAAELLGAAALSSDVLFRTLGLDRAALKTWQALNAQTKGVLQSYANGVNAYLAGNPLPPEHTALEITETEKWTPLHTLLIGKGLAASFSLNLVDLDSTIALQTYVGVGEFAGFDGMALFFEDTHRSAPPDDRVTDPGYLTGMSGVSQATESASGVRKQRRKIEFSGSPVISEETMNLVRDFKEQVDNAPLFKQKIQQSENPNGSNAWLVAGQHTESGYPMLANDPHLSLNTPAIWYENHLVYNRDGEEWHVNGVGLAGAPGVVLGCSSFACWGMTVNPLDVTDIFSEQFVTNALGIPTNTVYKGNPEPITQVFQSWFVNEVGDGVPNTIVRASVGLTEGAITPVVPRRNDGPIVGFSGGSALSLMYSGFRDTYEFTSFLGLNNSASMEDFIAALQFFDIAVQNVYYADIEGNIAWFTASEKPLREDLANFTIDGLPPWFVRDGTGAAANEWLPVMNPQPNQALDYEILPFSEMPQMINPAKGYVTNANNDPVGVTLDNVAFNEVRPSGAGLLYLNSHYASYRMGRVDRVIKASIESEEKVGKEVFEDLQANVELLDAELVLPQLLAIMSQVPVPPGSPMAQALEVLSGWDYSAHTGIAEGYDAGGDPLMVTEPSDEEVRNSAAATVWALWRSMLVQNTIDATLTAYGLGDFLPPRTLAYSAFKHHLESFANAGGVGASGINFFTQGLAETVAGSLQMALQRLASDEFAPAFANSTDVLDYRWGKLHRIVLDHTFNVYPFNVPNGGGFRDLATDLPGLSRQGGYEAVDASSHNPTADSLNGFMFGSGPSRRFVGVLAPGGAQAQQVIPGGQSGLYFRENYSSQLPLWLVNDYHDIALTSQDAEAAAVAVHLFGPAQ